MTETLNALRASLALFALTAALAACTPLADGTEECEPGVESLGSMTEVAPTCN
ncbi:MAG: hypothetical protein KJN93_04550 [Alphaproteobacteria bacterium]|nr:hypothetical protein [Alphaproteobacteria bacterium]